MGAMFGQLADSLSTLPPSFQFHLFYVLWPKQTLTHTKYEKSQRRHGSKGKLNLIWAAMPPSGKTLNG